ncbi:MAG: hypothetical protein JWO89_1589 [Verrucomicrobiaceae bacterium]|nr:hypothetical protein [Verrucomicrobiaceae bacterium]MDB6116680.1 hypothetical protein [Verrucomicrobiaceae bacterium]
MPRFDLIRLALLSVRCVFLVVAVAWAEEPAPLAFVTASPSGRFFFKMVPETNGKGHGSAFEVLSDGSLKELWKAEGWYARQLFLSDDGRVLVRLDPSHRGRTVSKTDLAVAFHKDGVLIREYHTADLVKQPDKVRHGKDSYLWLAPLWVPASDSRKPDGTVRVDRDLEAEPLLDAAGIFRLKTIDRIVYQFEADTGRLVKRTML